MRIYHMANLISFSIRQIMHPGTLIFRKCSRINVSCLFTMWNTYNCFTQVEKGFPIYCRNPFMNSIFTLCKSYFPPQPFPGKIKVLKLIWFPVLDSYYFIIEAIDQNNLVSRIEKSLCKIFQYMLTLYWQKFRLTKFQ